MHRAEVLGFPNLVEMRAEKRACKQEETTEGGRR